MTSDDHVRIVRAELKLGFCGADLSSTGPITKRLRGAEFATRALRLAVRRS